MASGCPLLHCDLSGTLPTRRETGYWVGHYFPLKDWSGRIVRIGAVVLEVTHERKVERLIAPFARREAEVDPTLEALERDTSSTFSRRLRARWRGKMVRLPSSE
jgi:hypothetical protein